LGTPPRKRAAYFDFRSPECQCVLAISLSSSLMRSAYTRAHSRSIRVLLVGLAFGMTITFPIDVDKRKYRAVTCGTFRRSHRGVNVKRSRRLVGGSSEAASCAEPPSPNARSRPRNAV